MGGTVSWSWVSHQGPCVYKGMFAQAFGAGFQTLKKVWVSSGVSEFHSDLPADAMYAIKLQVVAKQKYYWKALNTEEGEK